MARLNSPPPQPTRQSRASAASALLASIDDATAELRGEMQWITSPAPTRAADDRRHPVTGCRADTLFGAWLYPVEQFAPLLDAVWAVAESPETLRIYVEKTDQQRAERSGKPAFEIDRNGIAYLQLSGPLTKHPTSLGSMLGGTSMMEFRDRLREARAMQAGGEVKGIFIDADSWGGTAEGAAECANAIRKTAELMPVHVHAEDKATSGALWLGSQGSRFTGGRGAVIGSQGAILQLIDRSENFKRQGLKPVIVTTGKHKGIGAAGAEITDEQRAQVQKHVEQINAPFAEDVIRARKLTPKQAAEVAHAGTYVGEHAREIGLIDEVCTREEAIATLTKQLNGGGATGGGAPGSGSHTNPADRGLPTMEPLTAAQIERIHKIAGCEKITADAAGIDALVTFAEGRASVIAERDASIVKLTAERDAAVAKLPAPTAPELIRARATTARAKIENLGLRGIVNAEMSGRLNAMIGEAGKENADVLGGGEGATMIDRVLSTLEGAPAVAPIPGAADRVVVDDPKINPKDPAAQGLAQAKAYADAKAAQMQSNQPAGAGR